MNDSPVQAQKGGDNGQHYAPAKLSPKKTRYPNSKVGTVILHVEFYELET
jgi:hypothetical protein